MTRRFWLWFLAAFLLVLLARSWSLRGTKGRVYEAYLPDSGSVVFDIETLPSGNGSSLWMATHTVQGKTARFRIEFGPAKSSGSTGGKNLPIKFGEGRFTAEAGSDASALLAELKRALEATRLPANVKKSTSLPFTFANLGENLSQAPGGGFNAAPPGNWTAMKIFIGEGEQEGEAFLNFNPVIRKGQFSIKDADYGDLVLAELAKVL